MRRARNLLPLLGSLAFLPFVVQADGGDDAVADDAVYAGDDYVKYWTDYAILPKKCIVYNDVDMVVFSVFEHGYKQCSDDPMGTYITPTPNFVSAYLDQVEVNELDKGNDDYVTPDTAAYTSCTQTVIQNTEYWVQIGCDDTDSQKLAVNIYSDNTCETRSLVDGYDDANIDVSDLQLPFKQCQACVVWVDKNDDEIDDQFYENRQTYAPLCSTVWARKQECDKKCQKMGREATVKEGWNTSDKVLLTVLGVFGFGMLVAILQKRRKMSNKDALLEQAAMSAAGLKQLHVIGIFVLVVLVIMVFALLGLKNITWALLLIMNTALFAYLMKLTVDSGVSTGETIIGPDGTVIRHVDSDETSVESGEQHENAGTYKLPEVT